MTSMFNKEDYSDVTVLIQGTKLYAHRFVICVQSQFFANAFQGKKFIEGERGEIKFDEGSALAHWRVFEYLYTGSYSDNLKVKGLEGKDLSVTTFLSHLLQLRRFRGVETSPSLCFGRYVSHKRTESTCSDQTQASTQGRLAE